MLSQQTSNVNMRRPIRTAAENRPSGTACRASEPVIRRHLGKFPSGVGKASIRITRAFLTVVKYAHSFSSESD